MPHFFNVQPGSTLDQLDRELHELPRRYGQVLDLDAFRRQLESASGQRTAGQADTRTTNADTELRQELNLAFADLGGAAFALAHHGALNDERLASRVQRIHELYSQLDALAHLAPIDPVDGSSLARDVATA